jgi:catechol 2,3-dioxygenase-like lactoylglutathione lyase family enzyme
MEFLRVRLDAPARSLAALADFYGARLGIERLERADAIVAATIGETRLEFLARAAEPFYHFALLAPGNRFGELLDWARERTEPLPDPDSGAAVFQFENWGAQACYFHDPAGNIVELIAHRGVGETRARGPFAAEELLGLSELGLVGDPPTMARLLRRQLGLELWDGAVEAEGRLAFVGEPAKTLILCPSGRPWLPTGRAAEAHPLEALLSGSAEGQAQIGDSALIRCRADLDKSGALQRS